MKRTIAGATAAIAVAVVLAVGNYEHTQRVDTRFEAFRAGICSIAAGQGKTNARFYDLVSTLEKRALARERIDRATGAFQAAAADSDSARLYAAVLAGANGGNSKGVKELCG